MLIDDNTVTVKWPRDDDGRKAIWEPYIDESGPETGLDPPQPYLEALATAVKHQVPLYILMGKLQKVL